MKALLLTGYDGVASLRFDDVKPVPPGPDDVLIDVHAASLNPVDARITSGYLRGRVDFDLPHVLGRDCSGVVTDVGVNVKSFKRGDKVVAVADQKRWGTHAELATIDQATVAHKPDRLDHAAAASLPIAGLSALAGLVTVGKLRAEERVLIHAGAGGVGNAGIQIAKHLGAFVATTAGPRNTDYVRSLGADVVIDYTAKDFSVELKDYDMVFDVLGGETRFRSFPVLRSGGRIVHLSGPPMTQPTPRDDVTVEAAVVKYERPYLDELNALVSSGALRPTISEIFAFVDAVKAYEKIKGGHARGKLVIKMKEQG